MSFLVVQRTHEIGVRMALGAQRHDVLRLVILHALKLVCAGTIIGPVVALLSTSTLRSALYQVSALDLPTFTLVTLALAAVAFLASYVPWRVAPRALIPIPLRLTNYGTLSQGYCYGLRMLLKYPDDDRFRADCRLLSAIGANTGNFQRGHAAPCCGRRPIRIRNNSYGFHVEDKRQGPEAADLFRGRFLLDWRAL